MVNIVHVWQGMQFNGTSFFLFHRTTQDDNSPSLMQANKISSPVHGHMRTKSMGELQLIKPGDPVEIHSPGSCATFSSLSPDSKKRAGSLDELLDDSVTQRTDRTDISVSHASSFTNMLDIDHHALRRTSQV